MSRSDVWPDSRSRRADSVLQRSEQPRPLAQRIASARLDKRLEDAAVDILDRGGAIAQVLERLERAVRVAHRDEALHRVLPDVLDRCEPKEDATIAHREVRT